MYFQTPILDVVSVDVVYASINLISTNHMQVFLSIDQLASKFGMTELVSNTSTVFSGVNNITPISGPALTTCIAMIPCSNLINFSMSESSTYKPTVSYQQPIDKLSKLTIRWVDRVNNPLPFGPLENQLLLRFYTIQKKPDLNRVPELPPPIENQTPKNFEMYIMIVLTFVVVLLCLFKPG
jgi:hypothetical protein